MADHAAADGSCGPADQGSAATTGCRATDQCTASAADDCALFRFIELISGGASAEESEHQADCENVCRFHEQTPSFS
jgi:hypothetical protein